jgi:thiamine pyrophosphokinase
MRHIKENAAVIGGNAQADIDFLGRINWGLFDVFAVDHGADICRALDITPQALIGDFDSLQERTLLTDDSRTVIRLPVDKDISDLYYACRHLEKKQLYQNIYLFNADSGRPDHFYFNLRAVDLFGPHVRLISRHGTVSKLLPGKACSLPLKKGCLFSLLPLERSEGVSISGARYPLDNATLIADTHSLSNISEGETVVYFSKGRMLLFTGDLPDHFIIGQ